MRVPRWLLAACLLLALAGCGPAAAGQAADGSGTASGTAGNAGPVVDDSRANENTAAPTSTDGGIPTQLRTSDDPCHYFTAGDAEQVLAGYSLQRLSPPGITICTYANNGNTDEAVMFEYIPDSKPCQDFPQPLAGLGRQACQHEDVHVPGIDTTSVAVGWIGANGRGYEMMAANDHPQADLLARLIAAAHAVENRLH